MRSFSSLAAFLASALKVVRAIDTKRLIYAEEEEIHRYTSIPVFLRIRILLLLLGIVLDDGK
jgi:hypothetical protein